MDAEISGSITTPRPPLVSPERLRASTVPSSNKSQRPIRGSGITNIVAAARASDAPSTEACLVLIYPPCSDLGKRVPLVKDVYVLGRADTADIQFELEGVSRRHAQLCRVADGWMIDDLTSTNGSFVNDAPITKRHVLGDGDFIKMGSAIFKFLSGLGLEASYHEEIYRLTIGDELTGTHNKRYFLEVLEHEFSRSARQESPLSVLMIDIDHFKALNDTHGQLAGDHVLKDLGRRLLGLVRADDVLARYGGEEFAILAPVTRDEAVVMGETIRRAVVKSFMFEAETLQVTVSIGIATRKLEGDEVWSLIKRADDSLYRAKREGRDRVIAESDVVAIPRWPMVLDLRGRLRPGDAIVALKLAGRDVLMTRPKGAAIVDDLEGLLHHKLRASWARDREELWFGRIQNEGTLLITVRGTRAKQSLERMIHHAPARFAASLVAHELPETPPVFGPATLVEADPDAAINKTLVGLVKRLAETERGTAVPLPIALAMGASQSTGSVRDEAMAMVTLHEATLRWVMSCVAAELITAGDRLAEMRVALGKPVSIGAWMGLLRKAAVALGKIEGIHTKLLADVLRTTTLATLSEFVEDRNGLVHRGGSTDERIARKIVNSWKPRIERMIAEDLSGLLALVPIEIVDVDFDESDDRYEYTVRRMLGDAAVLATSRLSSQHKMRKGTVYLLDPRWDRTLALDPLVIAEVCPSCGTRELFFLDRLSSDASGSYTNPATGHVIDDLSDSRRRALERWLEA